MNQKILLSTIGALILGVVAWFALQQEDVIPAPVMPSAEQREEEGPAPAPAQGQDNMHAPNVAEAAADSSASVRVAVATRDSLLPLPDDIEWTEVRIIDKQTKESIVGADVHWYDNSVSEARQEQKLFDPGDPTLWRDPEQMALRFGWSTTSDKRGIARVHRAVGTQVAARQGSRYGFAALAADLVVPKDGFVLELGPDAGFEVQVLDATGEPAIGVPIVVAVFDSTGKFLRPHGWGACTVSGAPDGRARIAHTQDLPELDSEKPRHYRVCTGLPSFSDPGVRFDASDPPEEPIVLRLPATGSIKARATLQGREVAIDICTLNYEGEESRMRSRFGSGVSRRPDDDGWVRFQHVPLGKTYTLGAQVNGNWLNESVDGPTVAGAEVEVTMAPDADAMILTGRLLFEDRRPAAQCEFDLNVRGDLRHRTTQETDDDGRFTVVLGKRRKKNHAKTIEFSVELDGEASLVASAAPRELRVGTEDLGDVVLQEDELVVSGRCEVDGEPAKLTGTHVEYERVKDDGGRQWRWLGGVRLVAREDGSFEFRGAIDKDRLRLKIRGDHMPVEPIDFIKGQSALLISMRTGSALAATMLVPTGSWQTVNARLHRTGASGLLKDEDKRLTASVKTREDERQQADWTGLSAGTYELKITLNGVAEAIHTIPDVVVPLPEGGDARLVDIDLRDRLRVQIVRLFDVEGKQLERARSGGLFPLGQPENEELRGHPCWGKEVKLLLPAVDTGLLVAIGGYRPQRITCSGASIDVRLDPWPKVTVHVPSEVPLPEGFELRLRLKQSEGRSRRWRAQWSSGSVNELHGPPVRSLAVQGGKVEVPVCDEPRRLSLQVRKKRKSVEVEMPEQRISLATGSHRLRIDAGAMQTAIDAVLKKAGGK